MIHGKSILAFGLALLAAAVFAAGGGGGAGGGGEGDSGRLSDPDYAAGLAAWKAHDWPEVVQRMGMVIERQPRLADAWNYRAHAYRQLGRLEQAFQHYERALAIDPSHRGAHEYLGEAYLLAGRLADAEAELRQLDKLCWLPCEEYRDLKEQIARYKLQAGRSSAAASAVR